MSRGGGGGGLEWEGMAPFPHNQVGVDPRRPSEHVPNDTCQHHFRWLRRGTTALRPVSMEAPSLIRVACSKHCKAGVDAIATGFIGWILEVLPS